MSNRFHSKWHRTSHQTYKNPNILDAGWDPIASHDVPFSGDFVMAPSVSGWCISAEKNSLGDIYSWSPNNVITIDAHHDPSAEPPDPDNSTINLVAGIINFDISETNINGHLNVRDWVEISGMSGDGDTGYGLIVHESAVVSGDTSAIGDITTDGNLYVTGSEPSAGSAYFKSISATEATIVSALINEVDISASESNGYIMKTPNPQGKKIPNPMSISPGVNNFYLSGDTLYSNSWGYFEGELKTASALYADGPVTFADALNVSAIATFDNEIKVAGNAKVGAFGSFGTYVSAAGSDDNGYGLIIEKNANIKGNTNIGGTLVVTGATTLNTLTATGAADFDSTLNVDGATTLNGGVTVKTSPGNKSMTFDGEKIYRKNGTQAAGTFLFPSYGGTLVARPNSPLPPSGNIPMFDEYGNIVDSGNNAADKANSASLADPYESDHSSAYVVGDYVTHEGSLYKCKTDTSSPPGEWDDNNWDPVAVTDEIGGGGDRIVSRNGRTEVVANQDGTASIIDNEGQKGLNIPEGFSFNGISFEESGLVAFSGPYKLNGAPSNAWFWLPPGVDPSTWEYGTTTPAHIFLGGTSESEPVAVLHNGFMPLYAISGWNTDNPTLTRSQSVPYLPEDITVAMVPLEKTVATVDQIPIDTVSHQELDDALFNKVSQNAQFRMSIKDDGKVVISGCRYRSANSTTQPFSNTYCVVSSETSLFDGSGGKIDFKIFNSTNDELLYRVVGYATGNWTVLQNNLTSEAASYLPNVGGNIQFPIIITTNSENKVLEVYLTGSGATLHPWSNFTSWADSKTKTLATLQNIAPDFSMDSTYEVGDYVTYDGSLWKCKVAVTTAGQWTESDNWEQFIVMDEINSKIGDINSVLDSINGEAI